MPERSLPPSLPERAICRHAVRLLAISKPISAQLGQSGKPALWSSGWHSWPERRICANARRQ